MCLFLTMKRPGVDPWRTCILLFYDVNNSATTLSFATLWLKKISINHFVADMNSTVGPNPTFSTTLTSLPPFWWDWESPGVFHPYRPRLVSKPQGKWRISTLMDPRRIRGYHPVFTYHARHPFSGWHKNTTDRVAISSLLALPEFTNTKKMLFITKRLKKVLSFVKTWTQYRNNIQSRIHNNLHNNQLLFG